MWPGGQGARGQAFGFTYSGRGPPFLANHSKKSTELLKEVNRQVQLVRPGFSFTSLQVVLNGRALLHVDANNAELSTLSH